MDNKTFNFRVRKPDSTFPGRLICILVLCAGMASFAFGADDLATVSLQHPDSAAAVGAGGDSFAPIMSPEGRYVLFASTARNLALATNGMTFQGADSPVLNVYWRDRVEQRTLLASPGLGGDELGNNNSLPLALSTNGLLALIESSASNLVQDDTNSVSDIFVRDLEHGETVLVSMGTNGVSANGASYNAVMTPDGRYVAFASAASNLVANDTNNLPDVFLRDLHSGLTILVSKDLQPSPTTYTNLSADLPQITPDGTRIAFVVQGRNRTGGKVTTDINVRDLSKNTTLWASKDARSPLGLAASAEVTCFAPVLSDDGAFLAYEAISASSALSLILRYDLNTGSTNIINKNAFVANQAVEDVQSIDISANGQVVAFLAKTNNAFGESCVLAWDASSDVCTLVSANLTNGLPVAATCQVPRLDSQGRYVSFVSSATGLVTNSLSGNYHMYQRDLVAGTTALLDIDENAGGWPLSSLNVPILSDDGRFVAFECVRPDVTGHPNSDVFVLDRQTGTADLISQHASGQASSTARGTSFLPSSALSADGRFVVFASDAENLVPNDGNGVRDVFVRDLVAMTNLLVSINGRTNSGNGASLDPVISANGRYVAFSSVASDLVAGDTNSIQDIFVRDLQSRGTVLATVAYTGASANSNSSPVSLACDGRYLLFRSFAKNLVPGAFGAECYYIRDMQQGTNFVLTSGATSSLLGGSDMTPNGRFAVYSCRLGTGSSYVSIWDTQLQKLVFSNGIPAISPQVAIAPDGSRIAWLSNSAGVYSTVLQDVSTGANTVIGAASGKDIRLRFSGDNQWLVFSTQVQGTNQVYLRDLVNGTNILVSRSSLDMTPAAGDSDSPAVSPDGRFVVYRSFASSIVAGDTNGSPDIFLFDRTSGSTVLLSCARDGLRGASSWSGSPDFSADGKTIVFSSWASNLAPLDFNENADLFAYSIASSESSFYAQAVVSAGQPALIWPAAAGKTYRVQFKDDLSQASWQDAPGTVTINGTQASYTDPAPGVKRYFRIVEE